MTTPVVFRKFLDDGSIIALFPEMPGDMSAATCGSYMHVGQHSAASVALFYEGTVPANEKDYMPLLQELERIGYSDLRIYRKYQPQFTVTRVRDLNQVRQPARKAG